MFAHQKRSGRFWRGPAVLALCVILTRSGEWVMAEGDFQGATHLMPFDEEGINYSKAVAGGPISRLQKQIDNGDVSLRFDERRGYLPAVLEALNIPKSSQVL